MDSKLKGEVTPQGAKNEALQVICATLQKPEKVIIENIKEIIDVLKAYRFVIFYWS